MRDTRSARSFRARSLKRRQAPIEAYDGTIAGIDFEDIDEASAIFEGYRFKLVQGEGYWFIIRTK